VRLFAAWGERVAQLGPARFYAPGYFIDYPPALLYLLWPIAALFDGEALRIALKSISIPFDVAISLCCARVVWHSAGPARAVVAAGLWSFAPGAVIAGTYWGQVDAVGTLVILGALVAAGTRRWAVAGALAGLASVLKFQLGVALIIIVVAAAVEAYRSRSWRPLVALPVAAAVALAVALPFRQGPFELWSLLRFAADEYAYTSLYAFNLWSVVVGFWEPDRGYVVIGGVLLAAALAASCVPLWWRRDVATLLAAGACATLAFYFLPTRAHERYLLPAVALLVPFAAARGRVLVPYIALSIAYAFTLYFALVRTLATDVQAPRWLETTLFTRPAQIAVALVLMGCATACAVMLATSDRTLERDPLGVEEHARRWARRALAGLGLMRERIAAWIAIERAHERRVQRAALAVVLVVPMAFNAVTLLPEVTIALPSNNDDANHFAYVQRADEALANGEDPFDFWAPEMEFGFPPFVYYQHLPHLAVVALHRVTLGLVDLLTLFNVVRWLLLVLLPLTVAWSLRRMGFATPAAVAAGAAAGLLSGDGRFGLEYDSFVWRGWGMYTQLWAAHLAFLSLAAVTDLMHRGRGLLFTIIALSALALSHLIYAYMAGITTLVVLLVGISRANARQRLARLAAVAAAVALVTSYMWLPFLQSKAYLNVTQPYLPRWRFDSFGIGPILGWLVSGDLLDHGRLPVLTLLLGVGMAVALRWRDRLALLGTSLLIVWLVLWSGRATLGPFADLLPFGSGLHVHRFVGGVQIAAIIVIGMGASALWVAARADVRARRAVIATALFVVLLVPAMAERASYYAQNATWMEQTRAAIARDEGANELALAVARLPVARTYAGLSNDWGNWLAFVPFNSAKFADLLNFDRVPRVAKPYASLALNADLAFHFDDSDPVMYDLFNARYAVGALGQPVSPFLRPLRTFGRYTLYEAPTSGWVTFAATTTRESASTDEHLFFRMRDWLLSDAPGSRSFVRYDYPAANDSVGGARTAWCANGRVSYERALRDSVDALIACDGPATVVLKITYHPNWRVTVDDQPARTFMVSPGFIGLEMPAGPHFVTARYESTPIKTPLLLLAALTIVALVVFRRRLAKARWLGDDA